MQPWLFIELRSQVPAANIVHNIKEIPRKRMEFTKRIRAILSIRTDDAIAFYGSSGRN
jgi:hypothetical protein